MDEDENFDIYGDLNEFDASVKLKEVMKELEILKKLREETESDLKTEKAINKHLKAVISIGKKNFSSLLLTARAEVKRKEGSIAQMRRDLDDLTFRRNKGRFGRMEKQDKGTQTEFSSKERSPRTENGVREDRPSGRNRYDRFKDSVRGDDDKRSSKRKHDDDNRERDRNAKRRRSQPRSSSRDRNHNNRRFESSRRHQRESPRERELRRKDRSTEKSSRSRDRTDKEKSQQNPRTESMEKSTRSLRSRDKTEKEKSKEKSFPEKEKFVPAKEEKSSQDAPTEINEKSVPEKSVSDSLLIISPNKMEKLHQETQDAVQNLLNSEQDRIEKDEILSNPENLVEIVPQAPENVVQEVEIKKSETTSDESKADEAPAVPETENEQKSAVTTTLGNKDYLFKEAEPGVQLLYIKRKKRKTK